MATVFSSKKAVARSHRRKCNSLFPFFTSLASRCYIRRYIFSNWDELVFIVPPYVILSEAAEGGEVEESSHYDDKCGKIGAKILRLRRISYGSAQDDKLVRLNAKLKFEFLCHRTGQLSKASPQGKPL